MSLFFFKQKTAYEMRISDWSSDVCSSDLHSPFPSRRGSTRPIDDVDRQEGLSVRPQPLDRLGERHIKLAHVGRKHRHRHGAAVTLGQDAADHRLETVDIAVHLVAELGLFIIMPQACLSLDSLEQPDGAGGGDGWTPLQISNAASRRSGNGD